METKCTEGGDGCTVPAVGIEVADLVATTVTSYSQTLPGFIETR